MLSIWLNLQINQLRLKSSLNYKAPKGAFFSSQFLKSVEIVYLVLMWPILLKVDLIATKNCIKVEIFSIKSSKYLIFN